MDYHHRRQHEEIRTLFFTIPGGGLVELDDSAGHFAEGDAGPRSPGSKNFATTPLRYCQPYNHK